MMVIENSYFFIMLIELIGLVINEIKEIIHFDLLKTFYKY